ncbi:hypothetical protein QDR37_09550 [Amnibacterium sp. CER49]|uniref:hypothetical protein n=1 Tax=Amnibacterium sp. CER49 TaxID=3039161 RepID=UPI0024479D06|nr:hypothetical protein [Amnibacterium sp. CER49]MDH2444187.1 hypothetical protein [Amnibacterium sp. CER49]
MELSAKLQLRPGVALEVVGAPDGLELDGVALGAPGSPAVLAFVRMRSDLDGIGEAVEAARADRVAWIAYPKAGALGTDLNRDRLAAAAEALGIRPVRQIALDATWSALRFRPATPTPSPA